MVMDLYQSDTSFQPQSLIDNYESLVWTDRYSAHGDFELSVPWSPTLVQDLKTYKYLLHPESDRIMMVETATVDRETSTKTGSLVKLTGRSLEAFLDFRNNKTFALQASEVRTGSRAAIANYFVESTCVTNAVTEENLPGLVIGAPPSGTSVTLTVERGPIYSMVKQILDASDLGFKIYRTPTAGELIWQVYAGADYSGALGVGIYRKYSPDSDTLVDVSSLESIANYKNHITMIGAKASIQLYFDGSPSYLSGFLRRSVVVDAYDIGPDTTTTVGEDQAALTLRSYEVKKLDENKYIQLVDGEIPSGTPAELGDTVWVQDSFGLKTLVRINEKIWTSDATGNKRIPTFEAV